MSDSFAEPELSRFEVRVESVYVLILEVLCQTSWLRILLKLVQDVRVVLPPPSFRRCRPSSSITGPFLSTKPELLFLIIECGERKVRMWDAWSVLYLKTLNH